MARTRRRPARRSAALELPDRLAHPVADDFLGPADYRAAPEGDEAAWSFLSARARRRHRDAVAKWLADHPGAPTPDRLAVPRFTPQQEADT